MSKPEPPCDYVGIGTVRRWLRLNEVIELGPLSKRASELMRRRETTALFPTCEDTVRCWLSSGQEESSHQESNWLAPWSWTSSRRTVRNQFLLFKIASLRYFIMAAQAEGTAVSRKWGRVWGEHILLGRQASWLSFAFPSILSVDHVCPEWPFPNSDIVISFIICIKFFSCSPVLLQQSLPFSSKKLHGLALVC